MIGEIIGCQPRPTRLTADDHVMPYERGPLFTDHFGRNHRSSSSTEGTLSNDKDRTHEVTTPSQRCIWALNSLRPSLCLGVGTPTRWLSARQIRNR